MLETVSFSPEIAEDLVVPTCVGFGWRAEKHEHEGFLPDHATSKWFTIRRKSDDAIFVAYFLTTEAYTELEDTYETDDDDSPYVTEFGEVRKVNYDTDEFEYIVKVDGIVFTRIQVEKVEDLDYGGLKNVYKLADDSLLEDND